MKFVEFNDADGSHVLLNPKQIVAVLPYHYTRNDESFEGTKIYCTDGDTNPFRVPTDYDTVKKLLERATTEIPRAYVDGVKAEENVFRMMSDKEYFLRFSDSVDNGDGKVMARAIIRMLYGMAYQDEEELEGAKNE